jgi:hypothetical protein
MKANNINAVLLIALILTSCTTAIKIVSPTETAAPTSTFTPIPSAATVTPTLTLENLVPTSGPTGSLSAEGPWLVYLHNSPRLGFADVMPVAAEFIFMNQDGSGRTSITLPECDDKVSAFLMDSRNSANYMADMGGDAIYIFRPSQATGMLVYRQLWYSVCHTFFSGDEKGGLLASFYQAANASPELVIFELPEGKIRARFPLVRCTESLKVCEEHNSSWGAMMRQQPQWSPDGRYLAFVALQDATSSDLFVYDTESGDLRRLTNGPDWVGPIEWSPDGTHIIMQELLNDDGFFFDPHAKPPSSVWSVSMSTNEIKLLYFTGDAYAEQNILLWLDDKRFVAYEGFLVNADQATNLRFVDMETGADKILFDGAFVTARFDPIHEVIALYELDTEKYPQGIYLISVKNGTLRPPEGPLYNLDLPEWDENTGLFVSGSVCEKDPHSFQAFDYQGNFKCVPKPAPTPEPFESASYPAPNGKWSISVKDGLWVESEGKPAVLISQETASDIIWCPDSSCFFYSILQQSQQYTLYRVSLPELTVKLVDEGIEARGIYQWLGGEK